MDVLRREFVYIWYYFTVQLEQIFGWWVLGMVIGSTVSTFPVISGLCDDILAGYWTTCKPDRIRLKTEFSAREEKVAGQWMAKISRILVPSRTTDVGALISVPLGRKLESSKNQRYAAMGDLR